MSGYENWKLIVCLGNPGSEYASTRHNAGWQTASFLIDSGKAEALKEVKIESGKLFKCTTAAGSGFLLLLPMTYMNESGRAVKEVADKLGITPPEILVICDCMDLPVGKLRLRKQGSSGGQRGVESIIQYLQTMDFMRLRIGIGRPEPGVDVVDHVLSDWVSAESKLENQVLSTAAACAVLWVDKGYDSACRLAGECSADKINANLKGETEIGKV